MNYSNRHENQSPRHGTGHASSQIQRGMQPQIVSVSSSQAQNVFKGLVNSQGLGNALGREQDGLIMLQGGANQDMNMNQKTPSVTQNFKVDDRLFETDKINMMTAVGKHMTS